MKKVLFLICGLIAFVLFCHILFDSPIIEMAKELFNYAAVLVVGVLVLEGTKSRQSSDDKRV